MAGAGVPVTPEVGTVRVMAEMAVGLLVVTAEAEDGRLGEDEDTDADGVEGVGLVNSVLEGLTVVSGGKSLCVRTLTDGREVVGWGAGPKQPASSTAENRPTPSR